MTVLFGDFDATHFWKPSVYADKHYVEPYPTDGVVAAVEGFVGYPLPAAYVELCRLQNGGFPRHSAHRMRTRTSWAADHIAVTGIFAIGSTKHYSLAGPMNSRFWIEEWGYPPIGIYFADCPSAGHDMICLDYRVRGVDGEPSVVHVDQESDYRITFVASSFEVFIRGLEPAEGFGG